LRAVAFPPLRPAAFFCAVVPPWLELDRELEELDFFPPRLDAPGELAIFAARSLDMPFSLSFSYCFSFLTFADLLGMRPPCSYERFLAVAFPPFEPAARLLAVEALRLDVERAELRDVPEVERALEVVPEVDREVFGFAREVVDFAFDVAGFAREVVDFAFDVADFARDAVDFAFEVADFAPDVVADFAFEAADFARDVVADFAFEAVDFARDVPDVERARDVPDVEREREVVPLEERLAAVVRPPLLPAAFFCAVDPPRLDVERDELRDAPELERDRLVPLDLLDLRGVAARTRETASSSRDCTASVASSSGFGEWPKPGPAKLSGPPSLPCPSL
jgi:hypothetical protein